MVSKGGKGRRPAAQPTASASSPLFPATGQFGPATTGAMVLRFTPGAGKEGIKHLSICL